MFIASFGDTQLPKTKGVCFTPANFGKFGIEEIINVSSLENLQCPIKSPTFENLYFATFLSVTISPKTYGFFWIFLIAI